MNISLRIRILIGLVLLSFIFLTNSLHAQKSPAVRFTIGAKGWLASWNLIKDQTSFTGEYAGDGTPIYEKWKALSWGLMAGPYVTLSVGNFSTTISYAAALATFNTEYSWVADDGSPLYYNNQAIVSPTSVKRQDVNLVAVYRFVPEFGLFVNGKLLLYSYSASLFGQNILDNSSTAFTIGGGIVSSYVFPETGGLAVYGYLGALYNTNTDFDNEVVFLVDAGLAYRYVALGFRLEAGKDTGSRTTLGPTLSIYYTF